MSGGDGFEGGSEPGVGLDADHLGGFDERCGPRRRCPRHGRRSARSSSSGPQVCCGSRDSCCRVRLDRRRGKCSGRPGGGRYRRASRRGGTFSRRGRAGPGAAGRRFRPGERSERGAQRAAVRAGFPEGPATTALHSTDHLDRAEKLLGAVHGETPLRPRERSGVSNPETERKVALPHPLQTTKPGRPRLGRTRNPRWRGDCVTR